LADVYSWVWGEYIDCPLDEVVWCYESM